MMQFRLFVLFVCLFTVFSAENVNAVICRPFPDCKSLGFDKTKSYCQENGFPYIECPFNEEHVYCPGNCDDYPYDSCDATIGKCKQCAIGGKWKHIDCNPGYTLNEAKNKCESTLSVCSGLNEGELDGNIGPILTCNRGTISLFGYSDCNEGWTLTEGYDCVKNICDDEYAEVGYTSETCPNNVSCDTCKEGLVTKTKMTCPDGLFLQPKGDIAGEDYKCRKHLIGNIAFYCKDTTKIPNGLDTDGDQIISLEPDKYDSRPAGCEPIGVVFYNDDATQGKGNAFLKTLRSTSTSI